MPMDGVLTEPVTAAELAAGALDDSKLQRVAARFASDGVV